ncbi:uncharacterized protein LOC143642817 isoform X3 [Tamandua tetradactyla]|uniref:uncharacterized protein LOC143642817 isoform X3 n=1 Tax=Tamandua tetradactyla TaxID=48850 RepID=UPI0040546892
MNWLGDRFKKSSEMVAWLDKLLEELSACLTSHGKGEVCRTLGREEKKEEEKIRGEAAVLPGHRLELYPPILSAVKLEDQAFQTQRSDTRSPTTQRMDTKM